MVLVKAGDDLLSRYSHYHGPQVLNGRVRNGNGCGHLGTVTGKTHVFRCPRLALAGSGERSTKTTKTKYQKGSGTSPPYALLVFECGHSHPHQSLRSWWGLT